MKKRIALFAVTFMIVGASSPAVLALSPMGPPKAMLGQDQWAVGIEYAYEKMDLEAFGQAVEEQMWGNVALDTIYRYEKYKIKDLESHMILGRASYGMNENWDVFLRLGAAGAKDELERIYPDGADPDQHKGFDGSFGFAWGFGTRMTFWQDGDTTWGGLFQMTWVAPEESDISLSSDPNFSGTAEIEFWEVQLAIGPTWQLEGNVSIYGGPFLHFVNGDLDISGESEEITAISPPPVDISLTSKQDIREESQFGGYVGASWDANERTSYFIECQLTGDAWGIGLGAAQKF